MGLKVAPPDINLSEIKYTGKEKTIRVGLMRIKELSREARENIIHERNKNGTFVSIEDFLKRMDGKFHLQDVRLLIKAGCLDSISHGIKRPGLIWKALQFFGKKEDDRAPTLFDHAQRIKPLPLTVPCQRDYSRRTMLKHESETLGFLLSVHPLDMYRNELKGMKYVRAEDLAGYIGKQVTMVGWLVTGKTVRTKEGDQMKFISFEDTTGIYETVFFPRVYNRYCHMLNASRPYVMKGRVEEDFGSINVNVSWIGFMERHSLYMLDA
jgi:error-prone DNA polymerase